MIPRRRWLAGSLLGLVILAAASEFLVPALIGVLHRGTGVAALDGILAGRTAHSAGYYVERWRSFARPALAALAVLWAVAAVAFHPAVAAPLARMLDRASGGRLDPEPALPPPGRRRLVTVLASVIAGGSLLEIALDPPYRGEHWPFSQYQMYSLLPQSEVVLRRLYGVVAGGSGREIPLWANDLIFPFDSSRLWFSWNRFDASRERHRLLPIAMRDCLDRYETRRAQGLHAGPPLEAVRLYRFRWAPSSVDAAARPAPSRDLLWEVRASSSPTRSP